VLALRAVCRPWEAVICADTAHVNVDEGGAPERVAGVKLLTVETRDGKLTPADLDRHLTRVGDEHAVQPRLVTITQSTELAICASRPSSSPPRAASWPRSTPRTRAPGRSG
jgi:threonine aldolase